jgi:hypothetical protein
MKKVFVVISSVILLSLLLKACGAPICPGSERQIAGLFRSALPTL